VSNELRWGRIATVAISLIAALVAQLSGTLVALLGIFGWGLFASTLVPALAIGLNWEGATRAGAIASIATGLALTLVLETLAFVRVFTVPQGVAVAGLALVSSTLIFFLVSALTRGSAEAIDPDIRLVMSV
jgi:Na+/proline symporter